MKRNVILLNKSLKAQFLSASRYLDVFILAVFTILITLKPHFAHGKINIFEVGLYLPGIQSVLNGEIPYRDFFHLRGPLELYIPALLMKMFGVHLKVLYAYFYFGNILCLILCILIAKELFKTRYILYLMAPVLIGRAFPRVVFTYWGGMRYAFGLLALWFAVKSFKENKLNWMFGAGMFTAFAGFTSVEMGAYCFLGISAVSVFSKIINIQTGKLALKSFGAYFVGAGIVVLPYGIYLFMNSALSAYIDSVLTVVIRLHSVINPHLVSVYPSNFPEAFAAMTNLAHANFKHMTPSYLYIFLLVYLSYRLIKRSFSRRDLAVMCVGTYGFIMYNTAFRAILAAQFEMALQPEKILLFFLLEILFLMVIDKKSRLKISLSLKTQTPAWYHKDRWKVYMLVFLMVGLFGSSTGYSIARYNRRFFAFQFIRDKIAGKSTDYLKPLANEEARALTIERARGIIVPRQQADELERIAAFVEKHVKEDEEIIAYPEMGTYNFLVGRRHFGRFPISTFSWINDQWHEDYLQQLKLSRPRYVILEKKRAENWEDVYLASEANRKKYRDIMDMIEIDYGIVAQTPLSRIYKLK